MCLHIITMLCRKYDKCAPAFQIIMYLGDCITTFAQLVFRTRGVGFGSCKTYKISELKI
jgi:hypothetical protein